MAVPQATPTEESCTLSPTDDPWLLTPGPLTTSPEVKEAMLHDVGSRDTDFIALNVRLRERLLRIVDGEARCTTVPLQGSGTFVVEAMLTTFLPPDGRLLILINGAYGWRMAKICQVAGLSYTTLEWPEDTPVDPDAVARKLEEEPHVTHVALVHCETTSGVLNPIERVAEVVARRGRRLLIDSMSAFGALPLSAEQIAFDAVVASANKCLEGVPGFGFCIADREALSNCQGNASSLSLDLFEQWTAMEGNGQWRFTPPTHALLAFDRALDTFEAEGGQKGRGGRYSENCRILVDGMRRLGFETLLADEVQAPIIVTFHKPSDERFDFDAFYDALRARGFVIYPGKLTVADSFRIGCIGQVGPQQMHQVLEAIDRTLHDMQVVERAPKA